MQFEGAELGVSVHRGVYETAAVLYERFEPLVAEHMASSPFAKVAFAVRSCLLLPKLGLIPPSSNTIDCATSLFNSAQPHVKFVLKSVVGNPCTLTSQMSLPLGAPHARHS